MRYFYVPLCQISENQVRISGRELHQLINVVRLREGEEITVLDGSSGIYEVVLVSCDQDVAIGKIRTRRHFSPPLVEVALYVGLPKADKMDMIVQKATELGAQRIVPILCQHSVPRLSIDRAQQRVARWQQIVIEASKQSHRPLFPSVSDVLPFDKALDNSVADLKLIFDVRAQLSRNDSRIAPTSVGLKYVLRQNSEARKIDIFVGPEGGFSENEIRHALSAGAVSASLGNNILRTETAAIVALAIVLYEKDLLR